MLMLLLLIPDLSNDYMLFLFVVGVAGGDIVVAWFIQQLQVVDAVCVVVVICGGIVFTKSIQQLKVVVVVCIVVARSIRRLHVHDVVVAFAVAVYCALFLDPSNSFLLLLLIVVS